MPQIPIRGGSGVPDRRSRPRRHPAYTAAEQAELRILRVQLWGNLLYCLLSDHTMLCVPLKISPLVSAASLEARYQWQITGAGRTLSWTGAGLEERLRLEVMLAYPASETILPSDH